MLRRFLNVKLLLLTAFPFNQFGLGDVCNSGFNSQVMGRVLDRLEDFMNVPIDSTSRMFRFRESRGFHRHDLRASGRDLSIAFLFSETRASLYYGLEDGSVFFYSNILTGVYREPGNSGYDASQPPPEMEKHMISCVDRWNGEAKNCTMAVGATYVKCVDGCRLDRCPDEGSQRNCSDLVGNDRDECDSSIKWCQQYEFQRVAENQTLGYIPMTYSCIAPTGLMEQTPGHVMVNATTKELGNCYHEDRVTLVNRTLSGDYAYCGGTNCSNTFVGGFREIDYDPRYRGWYIQAKQTQKTCWTEPYVFFSIMEVGITYVHPVYLIDDGLQVFYGVIAVDYSLRQISEFLRANYGNTDVRVIIAENRYPHYVVATSTTTPAAKKVLLTNSSVQCPDDASSTECTAVRVPISEYKGTPEDNILGRSFLVHERQGFPDELIAVKESEEASSGAFVSQSRLYSQPGANLEWQIIVVMPMTRAPDDAVKRGSSAFTALCFSSLFGIVVCSSLLYIFYRNRTHPAVIQADWRFTCLFLLGCVLLNGTSFTFLGDNTDQLCMLRMWSFNAVFVCTLSPLFVKVWRMYRLVTASIGFNRVQMSHTKTFLATIPLALVEIVLLTVFSIVDPPRSTESFDISEGSAVQHITCDQNSNAFFAAQLAFHAFLIFVGCYLAFRTRDLDPRFGEAKQLGFAMYNIAFTGIIIVTILQVIDMNQHGRLIMQALGVLWGTVFSAFAFVLPRLIEIANKSQRGPRRLQSRIYESNFSRPSSDDAKFSVIQEGTERTRGLSRDARDRARAVETTKTPSTWTGEYDDIAAQGVSRRLKASPESAPQQYAFSES